MTIGVEWTTPKVTEVERSMVERMARAMFDACYGDTHNTSWAFGAGPVNVDGALKERFRTMARYALAAMREPTEAMAQAVEVGSDVAGAWRAMIDEALKG